MAGERLKTKYFVLTLLATCLLGLQLNLYPRHAKNFIAKALEISCLLVMVPLLIGYIFIDSKTITEVCLLAATLVKLVVATIFFGVGKYKLDENLDETPYGFIFYFHLVISACLIIIIVVLIISTPTGNRTGNPVEGNRQSADKICGFIFELIFFVWLTIIIAGFSSHQNANATDPSIDLDQLPTVRLEIRTRPTGRIIYSAFISTVAGFLYIFLTEKMSKIFVYSGLVLYSLFTISCSILLIFAIINFASKINVISTAALIVSLLMAIETVPSFISFFKTDKHILADIIRDSSRTILRSPLIVFLAFLATMLTALVISFTLHARAFDAFPDSRKEFLRLYDSLVNLGGTYTSLFCLYFAVMVVSEYTVNYYWEKDEKASYRLGRSIINTSRNIGTIMFAVTVLISLICQVVQAFKHKRSRNIKDHWFFYTICKVQLALMPFPIDPLIFSSIYGSGFVKSMQKTLEMVLTHPKFFLATEAAFISVFVILPTFMWLIGLIISIAIFPVGISDTESSAAEYLISGATFIPLAFILILVTITAKVLSLNQSIILHREDQ